MDSLNFILPQPQDLPPGKPDSDPDGQVDERTDPSGTSLKFPLPNQEPTKNMSWAVLNFGEIYIRKKVGRKAPLRIR
jgi:hypothetical protein